MGASKTFQYTNEQNKLALIAKGLGHSARVTIVEYLRDYGGITNYQAMDITQLADATVYHHIKELEKAGLIKELWIEDVHFYILEDSALQKIKSLSDLIG